MKLAPSEFVDEHHKEYTETARLVIIEKESAKYRAWVAKNAYLVTTLAILFLITWGVEVALRIFVS